MLLSLLTHQQHSGDLRLSDLLRLDSDKGLNIYPNLSFTFYTFNLHFDVKETLFHLCVCFLANSSQK